MLSIMFHSAVCKDWNLWDTDQFWSRKIKSQYQAIIQDILTNNNKIY